MSKTEKAAAGEDKRGAAAPATFPQRLLAFFESLKPDSALSPTWNMTTVRRVHGSLDFRKLEAAFKAVVQRQESLRTRLDSPTGNWRQTLVRCDPQPITRVDAPNLGFGSELSALVSAEANRPFDFSQPPLARVTVAAIGEDDHLVLLTANHTACDAWSMELLWEDLAHAYRQTRMTGSAELQPLGFTCRELGLEQQRELEDGTVAKRLSRWKARLGTLDTLRFPTSHLVGSSNAGALQRFQIEADLGAKVRGLCVERNMTPFSVLLAGFVTYLFVVTGQDNIAVPTYSSGRADPRLDSTSGFFLSPLILRFDVTEQVTFDDLLQRVLRATLEGLTDQDVPFDHLLAAVPAVAAALADPAQQILVFQVVMPRREALDFGPGISIDRVVVGDQDEGSTTPHDLLWTLEPQWPADDDRIFGTARYRVDRFSKQDVSDHVQRYTTVLAAGIDDVGRTLSSFRNIG